MTAPADGAAERAIAERRAQGLPDRVEDPAVLAQVAGILTDHTADQEAAAS